MRILTIVMVTLVSCNALAQDGPGGVAARNGASDLRLWLTTSDFVTHGYQTGDGVHTWMDLSGRGAHTNLSSSPPELVTSLINGLQGVHFEANDEEFLNGTFNTLPTAPLTLIAVANFSSVQPNGTGQYVIGLGGGSSDQASISRQAGDASPPYAYYSFETQNPIPIRSIGPTIISNQWYGFMSLYNNSAPYHSLYLNNFVQSIANDFTAPPTWVNQNFDIGRNASGAATSYLDGDIAEIIVFNRLLNIVERNILFNYLSAKYNITINNDLYSYDAIPNNFDLEVVGIGSENGDIQNTAVSGGLTITTNDAFGGSPDIIYVLWGHRTTTNTVNTFDVEEITNQLDARWSRTWGVDVTSSNGIVTVDLSFDFLTSGIGGNPDNASNYFLIRSAGIGLGWEIVATANNITSSAVNFNDITITDGIYTLATANRQTSLLSNANFSTANGPAGIGSTTGGDIALWLDASRLALTDGAPVATWPDLTTGARNATQPMVTNQPIYEENELNGLGVVRFNGINSFMAGSLGASFNAPFTLFAVARFAQTNQGVNDNDYIFDLGVPVPFLNQPGTRASISRRRSNDAIVRTNRYYSFQGDAFHYGPVIAGGLDNTHAFTSVYQLRSPYHQLYYNGALSLSAPGNTAIASNGVYHLGRLNNTNDIDYFLNGDIAEIIVYRSVLSSVQIRIIQSYLAAKWGFTLNSGDLYTGDNVANGDNDLAISGVGRTLEGDVGVGRSAGMTVHMGTSATADSFIMFGHNVTNNSLNTTDIGGAALFERSNRAWYFTLTGSVGSLDSITFDFSEIGLAGTPDNPANYVLIHRSGTSGNWSIAATASNTLGDRVHFTNVNLTTTGSGYYTLASVNNAPLPVSLLSFEASVITEGNDHAVLLKWQTASEVNNNYFTIERSSDGIKWNSLRDIPGKGTYNEVSTYQIIDQEPYIGKSYYRLKQTDNNEDFQYVGGVRAVSIKGESMVVNVFPNPSKGIITITSKAGFMDNDEVVITDFTGRILTSEGLQQGHHQQVRLNKKPGLYLLSIKRNNQLIYSQRIMVEE